MWGGWDDDRIAENETMIDISDEFDSNVMGYGNGYCVGRLRRSFETVYVCCLRLMVLCELQG